MKKILVIRMSAMGDVAMTVPVVMQLLNRYPTLHVDFLTRKTFSPIFPVHERLQLIFPNLEQEHRGLLGIIRLFRSLNKNRYDGIADLHGVLRSQIIRVLFKLAGTRTAYINKGRAEKKSLTRKENKLVKQLPTTHERYTDVFSMLGFPFALRIDNFYVKAKRKYMFGVAPFAAHRQKMWPLHRCQEFIRELGASYDCDIFLLGGGQREKLELESIAHSSDHIFSLAAEPLSEQIKKIADLDLVVSMDSANMHVASNVGVPVVSIWGGTHPFAGFLGYGQSLENCVQRDDLSCRPCSVFGNKDCWRGDWACLDIEVRTVMNKVRNALSHDVTRN